MEIYTMPSDLLRKLRKLAVKNGQVLLHYKKTNKFYIRDKSSVPPPPPTEKQSRLRQSLGNLSHEAATWLKANNPTVCPPYGTSEYKQLVRMFEKQHDSPTLLHFAMARIKKYGKVI